MSTFLQSLGRKGKDLLKKKKMSHREQNHTTAASTAAAYDGGPLYNIVYNPTFTEGTQGWFGLGCSLALGNLGGSTFCAAHQRQENWHGLAQDIGDRLEIDVDYGVQAWVGIGGQAEQAQVQATVKLEKPSGGDDYIWLGSVTVAKGEWSLVSGKFRISSLPKKAIFYLEGPSAGVDILASSVSIIPETNAGNSEESSKSVDSKTSENQENKTGAGYPRGLIQNPEFSDGMRNWREKGCKIFLSESMNGGKIQPSTGKCFAVAGNRKESWQGIEQEITGRIEESTLYNVAGLVRINGNVTEATVLATVFMKGMDDKDQYITVGKVQVSNSQWTEIKGDFLVNKLPKLATVYLEGPPGGVDLLVDNFTMFVPIKAKPAGRPLLKDPKYGVNIVENSNVENGLGGWFPMGNCRLNISSGCPVLLGSNAQRSFVESSPPALKGKFLYVSNRTQVWEGPAQTITDKVQLFNTYQVTAWVATAFPPGFHGPPTHQNVSVSLSVDGKWTQGGEVLAGAQWTEVSGSFRLETKPENLLVYFQGPAPGVDVMVAGLHIFAVNRLARVPMLQEQTDKVRKRDVLVRLHDSNGYLLHPGTQVAIQQTKNSFPIGSCISHWSLENKAYKKFFLEHFNWAVFENELKWGWTEPNKGELKYENADEMVEFCNSNGIPMRGHCILWETEDTVQEWVKKLDARGLEEAVQNRVTGLLSRYRGQFKHYDVNNEMLHGSFYKDILGPQFHAYLFQLAHQFDPEAVLFVNDYHVEDGEDCKAAPLKYIEHVRDLQAKGAPVGGIGLQGHLNIPIGPVISQALNDLSQLGLPIWFTEVDVESTNEHVRADDLEVIVREAFAHPSVEGLIFWGFWEGAMCRKNAHLVDSDKRINEAGRRLIALKNEWLTRFDGVVNERGELVFRGFQGDYTLTLPGTGLQRTFNVPNGAGFMVVDMTV